MHQEDFKYHVGQKTMVGHLVYDRSDSRKRPAVLIAHAWRGQDEFAREKALELARMGYVALAVDMYGDRLNATSDEEAFKLMSVLFLDRKELRKRIVAAFEALKGCPFVESTKIGAIGFCFGGLTVLELLRSGVNVRGVVSFHGVLGSTLGEFKAKSEPIAQKVPGAILLLHGNDDPLVTQNDLVNLEKELTQANVDWQINIYGHAAHAFTNPAANDSQGGKVYNAKITQRAWQAMHLFFEEILNG